MISELICKMRSADEVKFVYIFLLMAELQYTVIVIATQNYSAEKRHLAAIEK